MEIFTWFASERQYTEYNVDVGIKETFRDGCCTFITIRTCFKVNCITKTANVSTHRMYT